MRDSTARKSDAPGRLKTAFARRAEFYDRLVADAALSRNALAVAWRLVNHINDETGECFPSVERLAAQLNIDEKTVRRRVEELIARGWFTKTARGRGGSNYFPVYDRQPAAPIVRRARGQPFRSKETRAAPPGISADETRAAPPGIGEKNPGGAVPKSGHPDGEIRAAPPAEPKNLKKNLSEPAREGGAAPGGAPPSAARSPGGSEGTGTGPATDPGRRLAEAIAVFKTLRPAMAEAVGPDWKIIGATLFVIGASPGHMLLGQISDVLVDVTLRHRAALERVTGGKVEVIKRIRPEPGELSRAWKGAP